MYLVLCGRPPSNAGVRQYVHLDASSRNAVKNAVLYRRDLYGRGSGQVNEEPPAKKLKAAGGSGCTHAFAVKHVFDYLTDGDADRSFTISNKKVTWRKKGKAVACVPFGTEVIDIPSSPEPERLMDQLD